MDCGGVSRAIKLLMEVVMKPVQMLQGPFGLKMLYAALALGLGGIAWAAGPAAPSMADDPPAAAAPDTVALPSTTETAAAAFQKLAAGKPYVSREDALALPGFDQIFDATDVGHDGRLDADHFKTAWNAYRLAQKADRG
jgi:hypothetical protein